jgi:hypothetical protein
MFDEVAEDLIEFLRDAFFGDLKMHLTPERVNLLDGNLHETPILLTFVFLHSAADWKKQNKRGLAQQLRR